MTRCILFGAGASFGSQEVDPYPPPTGGDLFERLQEEFPDLWGSLKPEEEELFHDNGHGFEDGMGLLWDENSPRTTHLVRAQGLYFTQFRPLPGNTYLTLLEGLKATGDLSDTVFFSLNYDCVFSYAVRRAGYKVSYSSERPGENAIPVIKPHGSCNFLPDGVSGDAEAVSFAPKSVSWEGGIRPESCDRAAAWISKNAFYPAMAIYTEGKPVPSCGDVLSDFQDSWKETVLEAEKIGIIGVRLNVQDDHIWNPLEESDSELIILNSERARKNYLEWAESVGRDELQFPGGGAYFEPGLEAFLQDFS